MAQTTWAADTNTWASTTNVWANQTFSDSVTLASTQDSSNVGYGIYPATAALDATSTTSTLGGFAFARTATFGTTADLSASNNAVYVATATLATTGAISGTVGKLYTDSVTLGTTVDIPLPGLSEGWSSKTTTWASDTTSWGYIPNIAIPVTATITQLNLTELNEEDAIKLASAILGASVGTTASAKIGRAYV